MDYPVIDERASEERKRPSKYNEVPLAVEVRKQKEQIQALFKAIEMLKVELGALGCRYEELDARVFGPRVER